MMGRRVQLGLTAQQGQTIVATAGSGLMQAGLYDPEPISKAILLTAGAITQLFGKLFSFGYDPDKLNDTAITEGVQIALHGMWFNLTGEDLGGVDPTCTPGQCGAQHINIFSVPTQYPNVPYGPLGNPQVDIAALQEAAEKLIAEGARGLVRPQSMEGYSFNANYMRDRFQEVANARAAAAAANPLGSTVGNIFGSLGVDLGGLNIAALVPIAIGGFLLYEAA